MSKAKGAKQVDFSVEAINAAATAAKATEGAEKIAELEERYEGYLAKHAMAPDKIMAYAKNMLAKNDWEQWVRHGIAQEVFLDSKPRKEKEWAFFATARKGTVMILQSAPPGLFDKDKLCYDAREVYDLIGKYKSYEMSKSSRENSSLVCKIQEMIFCGILIARNSKNAELEEVLKSVLIVAASSSENFFNTELYNVAGELLSGVNPELSEIITQLNSSLVVKNKAEQKKSSEKQKAEQEKQEAEKEKKKAEKEKKKAEKEKQKAPGVSRTFYRIESELFYKFEDIQKQSKVVAPRGDMIIFTDPIMAILGKLSPDFERLLSAKKIIADNLIGDDGITDLVSDDYLKKIGLAKGGLLSKKEKVRKDALNKFFETLLGVDEYPAVFYNSFQIQVIEGLIKGHIGIIVGDGEQPSHKKFMEFINFHSPKKKDESKEEASESDDIPPPPPAEKEDFKRDALGRRRMRGETLVQQDPGVSAALEKANLEKLKAASVDEDFVGMGVGEDFKVDKSGGRKKLVRDAESLSSTQQGSSASPKSQSKSQSKSSSEEEEPDATPKKPKGRSASPARKSDKEKDRTS